ncbi:MAG: helix-turn-helix domain-containing protein [Ilumatobacteraceae bacterium]
MSRPAVLDPEILDLDVIDDPARAAPRSTRSVRGSCRCSRTGSATTLAASLCLPRQQVNYHLRVLEDLGLVHLAEERRRRGAWWNG